MATLNWEKDRARRQLKEFVFDDLPPAGSYSDQRRCGFYGYSTSIKGNRKQSKTSGARPAERSHCYQQLALYVEHAFAADFDRKWPVQKQEIAKFISKLCARCKTFGPPKSLEERKNLEHAFLALKRIDSPCGSAVRD